MGFLKKSKVPGELPDLAVADTGNSFSQPAKAVEAPRPLAAPAQSPVAPSTTSSSSPTPSTPPAPEPSKELLPAPSSPPSPVAKPLGTQGQPKSLVLPPGTTHETSSAPHQTHIELHKANVDDKEYVEIEEVEGPAPLHHIKKQIDIKLGEDEESFFDQVLDDINEEIRDLGQLEDWYKNKFKSQDVVSNMKMYWEGNKADIIIKSFGGEYKDKINQHIQGLQHLESEWRDIYFKLIKKEEEMKKEERILKETLSDFVDLCKRRKSGNEEKTQSDKSAA